jgi:hypothetical protein
MAPLAMASLAHATLIEALDMRTLVADSDHIVLGTIIRTEAHYDHLDRIVTDATLRIEESMWGGAAENETVVVRSLGGGIGDVGMRIEGEPNFETGARVMLFAREIRSEGVLRPVGMSQGVLPVQRLSSGPTVMPGGDGLSLVQRGNDGQLRPAPGALLEPTSLDAVLEQVRGLVAEIHHAR